MMRNTWLTYASVIAVALLGPATGFAQPPTYGQPGYAPSPGYAPAPGYGPQPATPGGLMGGLEQRIAQLHAQLGITSAEEYKFQAVADVMRSNARAMEGVFEQQSRTADQSAVGRLRFYAAVAKEHADGLQRLLAVFMPLYQSLSPSQRQTADTIFQTLQAAPGG